MSDATTHLDLPYLLAAQAQRHVTHNEALRLLDAMVHLSVLDRTRTTPHAHHAAREPRRWRPAPCGFWGLWGYGQGGI